MSNPQTAGSNTEHKLRVVKPSGALRVVFWDDLLSLLQSLFRKVGWSLLIDGADGASVGTDGTLRFRVGAGSSPAPDVIHPFYILSDGTLHAGTVNSTIPTLGGSPIGESGSALTLTGDMYVYVRNVWSLTFSTSHFLSSVSLTSSTIVTNSSPLTDSTNLGAGTHTAYRLVAQVIDGVVMREQQTKTNLRNLICDQSTGAEDGKSVNSSWSLV